MKFSEILLNDNRDMNEVILFNAKYMSRDTFTGTESNPYHLQEVFKQRQAAGGGPGGGGAGGAQYEVVSTRPSTGTLTLDELNDRIATNKRELERLEALRDKMLVATMRIYEDEMRKEQEAAGKADL